MAITTSKIASREDTRAITRSMAQAEEYCGSVSQRYQIDCIAEQYNYLSRQLPKSGDYGKVRSVLQKAARDLEIVVKRNRAKAAQELTTKNSKRALQAISKTRLRKAKRAASDIVTEAQTVLLRSIENSKRRRVAFERVSAAMGSNKKFLRSI